MHSGNMDRTGQDRTGFLIETDRKKDKGNSARDKIVYILHEIG